LSTSLSHAWEEAFGERVDLRILLVGPKGAGKNTVLEHLKLQKKVTMDEDEPGVKRAEKFRPWGSTRVTVCESGNVAHCLDKETFNALVLVVNLADVDGMEPLKMSMERMLAEESLKGIPLLVVAHVEDHPNSLTAAELVDILGLNSIWDRRWSVQSMEGVSNDALFEGMEWLASLQGASTIVGPPHTRPAEPALDLVARSYNGVDPHAPPGEPVAYRRYKSWDPKNFDGSGDVVRPARRAPAVTRSGHHHRFFRLGSAPLSHEPVPARPMR